MSLRDNKIGHFWLMLWHYLQQPLFDQNRPFIWNPFKLEQAENIQFLERCWELDNPLEKYG